MARIRSSITLARACTLAIVAFLLASARPVDAFSVAIVSTTTSSGSPLDRLAVGDTVTFGLRLQDTPTTGVFGLEVSSIGYDESVVDFQSGRAIAAFRGLPNAVGSELAESILPGLGTGVRLLETVGSFGPRPFPCDPGLDGGCSDPHFRIVFAATGPGTTVVTLGRSVEVIAGGAIIESSTAQVTLTVVPEPATALLCGLGLAALAATRRPGDRGVARDALNAPRT